MSVYEETLFSGDHADQHVRFQQLVLNSDYIVRKDLFLSSWGLHLNILRHPSQLRREGCPEGEVQIRFSKVIADDIIHGTDYTDNKAIVRISSKNDHHIIFDKKLSYPQRKRASNIALYARCKRLFNMKPEWITSVTVHCGAICRMNLKRQVANLESCGAFGSLRPVFNALVWGKPLNSGLRNLASRN